MHVPTDILDPVHGVLLCRLFVLAESSTDTLTAKRRPFIMRRFEPTVPEPTEDIQPRQGLTDWWRIVRPLRGRDQPSESVSVGFTYGYSRDCPSGKRERIAAPRFVPSQRYPELVCGPWSSFFACPKGNAVNSRR